MNVKGKLRELSGGRLVFVGYAKDDTDAVFVACRNIAGEDQYLKFSAEGAEALRDLLSGDAFDQPNVEYPHKIVGWRLVKSTDAAPPSSP